MRSYNYFSFVSCTAENSLFKLNSYDDVKQIRQTICPIHLIALALTEKRLIYFMRSRSWMKEL
jgi:hypothetical protein